MLAALPPGPRSPAPLQTLGWWARPFPFFLRNRERYGTRWTMRLVGMPTFVTLSDPEDVRQVLTAPPDVLHPGEGARTLEPVMGPSSVILLDGDAHLEQRRLLLPAFKGGRVAALEAMVTEVAQEAIAGWPRDTAVPLHGRLQRLTLDIILRAVFGLDEGPRLERLRELLEELMALSAHPAFMLRALQRDLGPGSFGRVFPRVRADVDALLAEQVAERRAETGVERGDVLAMLLLATHEDGSPMTFGEIRDELVTALVAGHETTASQLSWALALLARHPRVADRLAAELDAGDTAYLDAVVHEAMRHRPVLPDNAPRMTKQEVEIGGWTYPAGVVLSNNSYLVHHDPAIYPEPFAFRPERFLERPPETYTFLSFGGGRRRCLGASFAMLEQRVVLRELLAQARIAPLTDPLPRPQRRSITVSPADGATVLLQARAPRRTAAPAPVAA